jgi:HPt (histidine-containing phosphotransfer) domain-containing protein
MGEFDGPARTLHSLRGVSGMIGAVKLKAMTAQLEQAVAQREKQDSLLPKAVELRNELDALVAAVAERLGL